MNLRVLKKLSKRAAPILARLGDDREQFRASHRRAGENYHGLRGFPRKNWERSSCNPAFHPAPYDEGCIKFVTRSGRHKVMREPSFPLKGTIMVGAVSGYFEPEWSEETAWGALAELVYWHFTEYSKISGDLEPTRSLRTPSEVFAAANDILREAA